MNIRAPQDCHLPLLRRLWKEAFGDTDDFLDCFYSLAFSPDRCRLILEDDTVVAALYWFDCLLADKPIAYLYGIATASDKRGQGFCHKLMKDTHKHLAEAGYQGALLVPATPKLFTFYKKMGYETTCYVNEFLCKAQNNNTILRPITKEEYASLRRKLLPTGGAIQENENLDFLQQEALLYAGDTFLLAARKEGNRLRGLELLGRQENASGIVHALGFEEGNFRTPGKNIPFAMYLPFDDAASAPTYFGIAFD